MVFEEQISISYKIFKPALTAQSMLCINGFTSLIHGIWILNSFFCTEPELLHVPTAREDDRYPGSIDVEDSSSSRLPAIKFSSINRREWTIYIISILVAIGALLMIILLPLSFSYIEYYQVGRHTDSKYAFGYEGYYKQNLSK